MAYRLVIPLCHLTGDVELDLANRPARDHIVQNNRGLAADIIRHNPLTQFRWVGREYHLDIAILWMIWILSRDSGRCAVGRMPCDHSRLTKVNVPLQNDLKRRLVQRVTVRPIVGFGIKDRHLSAACHDKRIVGRIILEPNTTWAFDVNLPRRQRPIRIDLRGRKFVVNPVQFKTQLAEPEPEGRVWTVTGSKGDTYQVNEVRGDWSCSCSGFKFRGECKHVKELRS